MEEISLFIFVSRSPRPVVWKRREMSLFEMAFSVHRIKFKEVRFCGPLSSVLDYRMFSSASRGLFSAGDMNR